MVATMLHSIATGNILPASVPLVCVDINPATVTKLADRGSAQAVGIVTDIGLFLEGLARELVPGFTAGVGGQAQVGHHRQVVGDRAGPRHARTPATSSGGRPAARRCGGAARAAGRSARSSAAASTSPPSQRLPGRAARLVVEVGADTSGYRSGSAARTRRALSSRASGVEVQVGAEHGEPRARRRSSTREHRSPAVQPAAAAAAARRAPRRTRTRGETSSRLPQRRRATGRRRTRPARRASRRFARPSPSSRGASCSSDHVGGERTRTGRGDARGVVAQRPDVPADDPQAVPHARSRREGPQLSGPTAKRQGGG